VALPAARRCWRWYFWRASWCWALFLQLGLEVFDGVAAGVELGLLRGRVDLHQQLAFLDRVAGFDVDLADLPGGLGAHIHIAPWLQGAQGGDAAFDRAATDGHGGQVVAPCRQHLPGGDGDEGDHAGDNEQGASGGARAFHA
jgi:hypothetical protein